VFNFDRVLIDPEPKVLEKTLAEASAAGNKGLRSRKLPWPPDDFAAFLTELRSVPEGQRQWSADRAASTMAMAWWSDPHGRKHCRVVSQRGGGRDLFQPDTNSWRKGRERPVLWRVYPDDLCLTEEGEERRLWGCCRCGASGRPEDLGWMGPWCAACHDRAEEGEPQTRPGVCRPVVFSGHPFWVGDVAFSPDGRTLLVRVGYDPAVWMWDTLTGKLAKRAFPGEPHNSPTNGLTLSADGKKAALCIGGRGYTWSLTDGSDGPMLAAHLNDNNSSVALAFNPDGTLLASAYALGPYSAMRVIVHDAATGQPLRTLPVGDAHVRPGRNCLAFSPDGRTLALGWKRPLVRLWDPATGQELPPLPGGDEDVAAVAFSPDGKTLAVGNNRGQLWLWDMPLRTQRGPFKGSVAAVAFSPNGRLLATVGEDSRLRLRDAADGRLLGTFRWHQGDMDAVAFSPDGQWLATAGKEDRVKLWPVDGLLAASAPPPAPEAGSDHGSKACKKKSR
jgi:WD40 repeat protein